METRKGRGDEAFASLEAAEKRPHVTDQEVGRFHGGEVAAAVELTPVHYGVALLGEAPDDDVRAGEHRYASRHQGALHWGPGAVTDPSPAALEASERALRRFSLHSIDEDWR